MVVNNGQLENFFNTSSLGTYLENELLIVHKEDLKSMVQKNY